MEVDDFVSNELDHVFASIDNEDDIVDGSIVASDDGAKVCQVQVSILQGPSKTVVDRSRRVIILQYMGVGGD